MEAVEDRSSKFPVVVPVSTDVDEILASDPPLAITDVVWGILSPIPVVKEFAVNVKAFGVAAVEVKARTAFDASLLLILTTSFAVAGERVVLVLVQKPAVPELEPVTLPLQVRFPVVPSRVQPVSAEPPDKTILPTLEAGPILTVVFAAPVNKLSVAAVEVILPPLTARFEAIVSAPAAVTTQLVPFT